MVCSGTPMGKKSCKNLGGRKTSFLTKTLTFGNFRFPSLPQAAPSILANKVSWPPCSGAREAGYTEAPWAPAPLSCVQPPPPPPALLGYKFRPDLVLPLPGERKDTDGGVKDGFPPLRSPTPRPQSPLFTEKKQPLSPG